MGSAIIISIISSLTAIVVAILSIVFNGKNQKNTSFELEKLKLSIDLEKKSKEEHSKQKSETLNAIDLALEYSQKIKDDISVLTNYLQFESELTREWFEKTRKEILNYTELFSKIFPKFDMTDQKILHDMKKNLYQVDFMIAKILYDKKENHNIEKYNVINILLVTRQGLSEMQQNLLVRKTTFKDDEKYLNN